MLEGEEEEEDGNGKSAYAFHIVYDAQTKAHTHTRFPSKIANLYYWNKEIEAKREKKKEKRKRFKTFLWIHFHCDFLFDCV